MINEDFDDGKYLNALLEANRADFDRFKKWFLRENVTQSDIIREAELLMEKVDYEKSSKFVKDKMKHIETTLKKHGVSVSNLKAHAKGFAGKLETYHKKGLTPDQASKKMVGDLFKVAKDEIVKVKKKFDVAAMAQEGAKKVLISIAFYIIIVVVNTAIFIAMAKMGVNPFMLMPITAIVVAPMVEEAAKNYFIQKNMPWVGTGVVFGIEAVTYVFAMMSAGLSVPAAIITRVIALLMHFGTTAVQKAIMKQKDNMTPEEESKYMWAAWVAGVMIHASWNALALTYNQELMRLLK
jgi:hypothetical protein